jgi:hypothetical protein
MHSAHSTRAVPVSHARRMLKFPAVLITHLLIYCCGNLSDQLSVQVSLLLSAVVPIWREFVKVTVSQDEIFP